MSRGCGGHGNGAADTRACGRAWSATCRAREARARRQRVEGVVACPEMVGFVSGAGWSCGKLAELAVHRGYSTEYRLAVHRRLRAAQGAKIGEVGLVELGSTRGLQGTCLFPGFLLGENDGLEGDMSMV